MRLIYTLGTSNRTTERFLNLIKAFGIQVVIDIRRFPTSRFEHFKKEKLKALIESEGMRYVYLGEELGGYRKGGYKSFIHSPQFLSGLDKLEREGERGLSLILCAERFPWRCHRRFVAQALQERGWEVQHIIDEKRIWSSK